MSSLPCGLAGFRGRVVTLREGLWKGGPYKPLTEGLRKSGGRNSFGRITVWHRGGGSKRLYRQVLCCTASAVSRLLWQPLHELCHLGRAHSVSRGRLAVLRHSLSPPHAWSST